MQEAKPELKNDLRRQPKLGDHLLSPFITRCLDLNVNAVDKRVTEWALANFGSAW